MTQSTHPSTPDDEVRRLTPEAFRARYLERQRAALSREVLRGFAVWEPVEELLRSARAEQLGSLSRDDLIPGLLASHAGVRQATLEALRTIAPPPPLPQGDAEEEPPQRRRTAADRSESRR